MSNNKLKASELNELEFQAKLHAVSCQMSRIDYFKVPEQFKEEYRKLNQKLAQFSHSVNCKTEEKYLGEDDT